MKNKSGVGRVPFCEAVFAAGSKEEGPAEQYRVVATKVDLAQHCTALRRQHRDADDARRVDYGLVALRYGDLVGPRCCELCGGGSIARTAREQARAVIIFRGLHIRRAHDDTSGAAAT